jgi:uroporphyrinogen-III synthase
VATVDSVVAYVQIDRDLFGHGSAERLKAGKYDLLLATSGQAFLGVLRHLDENGKKRLINGEAAIVALGQVTAAAIQNAGYPVARIAKSADSNSLTQAVVDAWTKNN